MNFFHRHKWQIVSRTYAPPLESFSVQGSKGIEAIRSLTRLATGVTTTLVRCECGAIKQFEALGQEVKGVYEIKVKEPSK